MAKTEKDTASKAKEVEVQRVEPGRAPSPFEEMDRVFEGFFPRGWMRPGRWELPRWAELGGAFEHKLPRVDVIDRDKEVVVRAELPGVDKKDLDISMTENAVSIKGATSHEEEEERGDYYRCEISRGSFTRTVALPSDVDVDNTSATFKDGVLELVMPKVAKARRRTIKVD